MTFNWMSLKECLYTTDWSKEARLVGLSLYNCIYIFPLTTEILHNEVFVPWYFDTVIAQSISLWATGWMIGVLGFDSRRGLGIFLSITASRTALGPTHPLQWVSGTLFLGVKRPGREADHSPPSSAEVKEWVELYLHSPICLHGVLLS
jgi:hypothetical protein